MQLDGIHEPKDDPVERLVSLVEPPNGLWNYIVDWEAIESALGAAGLPDDYKQIVQQYGPGRFDDHLMVLVPPEMDSANIVNRGPHLVEDYESFFWDAMESDDNLLLPGLVTVSASAVGLTASVRALGWGGDGNGGCGYWLITDTHPNNWPVLYAWYRGESYQFHPGGLAEFLVAKISGEYGDEWSEEYDHERHTVTFTSDPQD